MRKGLTELVFILDRSGSMSGLEADTIGGFNSLIEKQKKEEGEAIVSTVLFDDKVEVLHDRIPIAKVEPMNDRQYYVRGCTALLDAIGGAIHHIGNVHKYAREEDVPEKTLFVITTDGCENSSREYTYDKVKKLVERQQEKYGWEFLFLGANIDAIQTAGQFGIKSSRAVQFECDGRGVGLNYEVLGRTISRARKCAEPMVMAQMLDTGDWKAEINEDFAARSSAGRRSSLGVRNNTGRGGAPVPMAAPTADSAGQNSSDAAVGVREISDISRRKHQARKEAARKRIFGKKS